MTVLALAPQATLAQGTLPLAPAPVQSVVDIDNGDARVLHDRQSNMLTLALYQNRLDIPLSTFEGTIRLTGGGSTMDLSRKHANSPVTLEVNYYWCGYPRNGMIYEKHSFDGNDWKLLKSKDRS